MNWEDRNCKECAFKLGCPHNKFVCFIEPPNRKVFMKNYCIPYEIRNKELQKGKDNG